MINVLTIEREYGSGAPAIAENVAGRLGWKLWDELLTTQIAGHLDCDKREVERREEVRDALYYRLFKAFMRGSLEGSQNTHTMKMADADCIREMAERVVRSAAAEGNCVIVGRGSAYYLHGTPGAFHVFLYAPFEEKVRRVQETGKTEKEAIHLVETVDHDRATFIKKYFGVEWPPRQNFHMMINSEIGDGPVVETILAGMNAFQKA